MFSGFWTPRCLSSGPGFKSEVPLWPPQAPILHPPTANPSFSGPVSPHPIPEEKPLLYPKGQRPQTPGSLKPCQVGVMGFPGPLLQGLLDQGLTN